MKLKKTLGIVALMSLLLLSVVSAGHYRPPVVDCNDPSFWEYDNCIEKHEGEIDNLQSDVDTLEKKALQGKKTDKKQNKAINGINNFLSANDAAYREQDGNGISKASVWKILRGDYLDYLKTIFLPKSYAESVTKENDYLKAEIILLKKSTGADYDRLDIVEQAKMLEAERTGEVVAWGVRDCTPKGCFIR